MQRDMPRRDKAMLRELFDPYVSLLNNTATRGVTQGKSVVTSIERERILVWGIDVGASTHVREDT